jgi:hypothetical protein
LTSTSWPLRLAAGAAGFSIALGLTVLAGWLFQVPRLDQVLPQLPPMTRTAAACLLLCGLAMLLVALESRRWLAVACAGAAGLLSILTILELIFNVNTGIDELLGPSYNTFKLSSPGRMSPVSAVCFSLASMRLMMTAARRSQRSALWSGVTGSIIAATVIATP